MRSIRYYNRGVIMSLCPIVFIFKGRTGFTVKNVYKMQWPTDGGFSCQLVCVVFPAWPGLQWYFQVTPSLCFRLSQYLNFSTWGTIDQFIPSKTLVLKTNPQVKTSWVRMAKLAVCVSVLLLLVVVQLELSESSKYDFSDLLHMIIHSLKLLI